MCLYGQIYIGPLIYENHCFLWFWHWETWVFVSDQTLIKFLLHFIVNSFSNQSKKGQTSPCFQTYNRCVCEVFQYCKVVRTIIDTTDHTLRCKNWHINIYISKVLLLLILLLLLHLLLLFFLLHVDLSLPLSSSAKWACCTYLVSKHTLFTLKNVKSNPLPAGTTTDPSPQCTFGKSVH